MKLNICHYQGLPRTRILVLLVVTTAILPNITARSLGWGTQNKHLNAFSFARGTCEENDFVSRSTNLFEVAARKLPRGGSSSSSSSSSEPSDYLKLISKKKDEEDAPVDETKEDEDEEKKKKERPVILRRKKLFSRREKKDDKPSRRTKGEEQDNNQDRGKTTTSKEDPSMDSTKKTNKPWNKLIQMNRDNSRGKTLDNSTSSSTPAKDDDSEKKKQSSNSKFPRLFGRKKSKQDDQDLALPSQVKDQQSDQKSINSTPSLSTSSSSMSKEWGKKRRPGSKDEDISDENSENVVNNQTSSTPPLKDTTETSSSSSSSSSSSVANNETSPQELEPSSAASDIVATNQTIQSNDTQNSQPANVIFLGGPNDGTLYRVHRQPPKQQQQLSGANPQQQQLQPFPPHQQQPQQLSPNVIIIVEIIAQLVRSLTKLWLGTWLVKRLALQEESMAPHQHFVWERLNDRYVRDASALGNVMKEPPHGVSRTAWGLSRRKVQGKRPNEKAELTKVFTRTVVVVELNTDSTNGPDVEYLSDVISFVLQQHESRAFGTSKEFELPLQLEIVFLVQSPGGSVASFGLAAAQIRRLCGAKGISTTVCVDKYAASGGYMIASQANKLVAAPFATIGSVGVIMEGLNFHDLARRCGVYPLVVKAGNSKNPFTTFGQVTRENLEEEQKRLEKVHDAFKDLIVDGRPVLKDKLAEVADGSVFLGQEALSLGMVDEVMTSSEYILERIRAGDRVLKLHRCSATRFARRVNISPLDILPHLKAWWSSSTQRVGMMFRGNSMDGSVLDLENIVQVGFLAGYVGFVVLRSLFQREGC